MMTIGFGKPPFGRCAEGSVGQLTHNEMLLCHCCAELMNGKQPDWTGVPQYLKGEILIRAQFLRGEGQLAKLKDKS